MENEINDFHINDDSGCIEKEVYPRIKKGKKIVVACLNSSWFI